VLTINLKFCSVLNLIYKLDEVTNFFEQIGNHTKYIIDPEEITADNFAFWINGKKDLPRPEIVDKIRSILTE